MSIFKGLFVILLNYSSHINFVWSEDVNTNDEKKFPPHLSFKSHQIWPGLIITIFCYVAEFSAPIALNAGPLCVAVVIGSVTRWCGVVGPVRILAWPVTVPKKLEQNLLHHSFAVFKWISLFFVSAFILYDVLISIYWDCTVIIYLLIAGKKMMLSFTKDNPN